MASSINPSNSHVLNTLVFNAGQLRRLFNDVTEMPVSSSVSSYLIKRPFVESEIYSSSVIASIPSVRFKYINTSIQSTSSVNASAVRIKFVNTSITGDTESIVYEPYRDSYTDVTSVETFSYVESIDSYINSYVENTSTTTSDVDSAAIVYSYRNATIDETSTLTLDAIVRKSASVSIPGDTESVLYTVFRRSETDTTSINTTSTLNIPFIVNKVFNTNINSNSSINNTSIPVRKLFNTNINNTSNLNTNIIKFKLINFNITGDTEAFSYTVYRDVNTGITPVVTRSTAIVPTIIRHYYDVSNINNTTSFTYSLSRNIVRYSDVESISSARVVIPSTIFTDISSITASTDSSITTIRKKINNSSIINNTSTDSSAYRYRIFSSTIEKDSSVEYKVVRNKYIQSSFVDLSDVHLEQSGFLLYYKGKLKLFICPKSSPHHPAEIEYRVQNYDIKEYNSVNHNPLNVMLFAEGSFKTASHHFDTQETIKNSFISICTKSAPRHPENIIYKVKGLDKKETLPFNSFILGNNKYNEGSWLTSSYHFDTQETVKENTVLTIKKPKFVALSGCVEKPSLYFKASSSLLF